jgi:hypothetical protein
MHQAHWSHVSNSHFTVALPVAWPGSFPCAAASITSRAGRCGGVKSLDCKKGSVRRAGCGRCRRPPSGILQWNTVSFPKQSRLSPHKPTDPGPNCRGLRDEGQRGPGPDPPDPLSYPFFAPASRFHRQYLIAPDRTRLSSGYFHAHTYVNKSAARVVSTREARPRGLSMGG